jgi:hypothetical protein
VPPLELPPLGIVVDPEPELLDAEVAGVELLDPLEDPQPASATTSATPPASTAVLILIRRMVISNSAPS